MPHSLRLKLSIIVGLICLIPLVTGLILTRTFNPIFISVGIITTGLASFVVWWFLRPLESLFQSVQILKKGQFQHRVNLKGSDELSAIGQELNQLADYLIAQNQTINNENSVIISQKNRWETIFSTIIDGVVIVDIHRNILLINKAAEHLTGYSQAEAIGKPVDQIIKLAEKDGRELTAETYCPIHLVGQVPPQSYRSAQSLAITNKTGQRETIRLASSPIMTNPQADLGCVVLLQDAATEREFESIQLDFVSMASHELRTPLTSIIGYLSIYITENQPNLDAHQRQFLDRVLISAKQLAALIETLLSVSKVERGALRMAVKTIDWTKNLTQVVHDNQIQASQKNISVTLNITDPGLPAVKADNMRINEVLNNLIANAINYTDQGGSITVSARHEKDEVITSVKDTGRGIPKEALPHLFTKFFRVSTALADSSNSKGTGLGLFLSKSIIDLHHGRIWVESEIGKGSTFSFSLPIDQAASKSVPLVDILTKT